MHFPQQIDVRAIRAGLRLSQRDFAAVYGFTSIKSGIGSKAARNKSAASTPI
jgi:hypothetical protein